MKELELKKPIKMKLVQYQCPGCERKFYVNEDDVKSLTSEDVVDCPFCDIAGIPEARIFEIEVQKIFEKEEED